MFSCCLISKDIRNFIAPFFTKIGDAVFNTHPDFYSGVRVISLVLIIYNLIGRFQQFLQRFGSLLTSLILLSANGGSAASLINMQIYFLRRPWLARQDIGISHFKILTFVVRFPKQGAHSTVSKDRFQI